MDIMLDEPEYADVMLPQPEELLQFIFSQGDENGLLQILPSVSNHNGVRLDDGKSLVYSAARNGWWDSVRLMCTRYGCVPTDSESSSIGYTILHMACETADTDTVKYLTTDFCLDPEKRHIHGKTPLDYSTGTTKEYLEQLVGKCNVHDSSAKQL